jgi:hypothetical protein
MSSQFTPTEFDFLGDLCRDNFQIREVFEYVKLHNKKFSDEQVFQTGEKILSDWLKQGWIEIIDLKTQNKFSPEEFGNLIGELKIKSNLEIWIQITPIGEKTYFSSNLS